MARDRQRRGQIIMVANHARKKMVRKLMARSKGTLSYIGALSFAARLNSLATDGLQIELSIIGNGSYEILDAAAGIEDSLTALRFAQSAIEARYQALATANDAGTPVPEDVFRKELMVAISGEHSPNVPEEARQLLKYILVRGRSVGVYSIIVDNSSKFRSNLC